jgi:UDP-N-acetylmuramoyl-L-alanyl-D-glutamate--2,6-diaminopimelate ligase
MMAAVVAAMTRGELLGPAAGTHAAVSVTDIVSDSRQVTPGAAFVALAGERSHGLDFAEAALAAGASIVVYEPPAAGQNVPETAVAVPELRQRLGDLGRRFYGRKRSPDGLIGVTGTNGKTTVAWLIAQGLALLDEPCAYLGTLGYGVPGKLKSQTLTTPDCLTLHRELAELDLARAVLEVSSHALAQDRIAGLGFELAVFTNLSREHLDWHGSMEAYFDAKARLFERAELRSAVVNVGDAAGGALLERLASGTRGISYALGPDQGSDVQASFESLGLAGMLLDIGGEFGRATIESPLLGEFNAENLLAATGALLALGHDLDAAAGALAVAAPPPGRLEVFGGPPERPWVIVDYAHTPDALARVLGVVSSLRTDSGSLTCVFGCGGDRDHGKRAAMGAAAADLADHIVLTDDNPRSEDPANIIADIREGIPANADVRVVHARDQAIAAALAGLGAGDVVVVAGKGHETRQLIGSETRDFDDRAVVRRILEGAS